MILSLWRTMRMWTPGFFFLTLSAFLLPSPMAHGQSSSPIQTKNNRSPQPASAAAGAQQVHPSGGEAKLPDRTDMLRGAYGPFRANNDLLYYHLVVRVDPEQKTISGKNTIRFRMLKDGTRIQLDLQEPLKVDKILLGTTPLKYERDSGAVFIDFPRMLRAGQVYSIDFYYSGKPVSSGRFGGITFGGIFSASSSGSGPAASSNPG